MHTLVVVKPWNSPWQQKINWKTEQLKNYYRNLDKNILWPSQTLGMSSPTSTVNFLESYDTVVYFNLTVVWRSRSQRAWLTHTTYRQTDRQIHILIKFIVVWGQPVVGFHSSRQECWQTVKSDWWVLTTCQIWLMGVEKVTNTCQIY